jgi:hypothetical protein
MSQWLKKMKCLNKTKKEPHAYQCLRINNNPTTTDQSK